MKAMLGAIKKPVLITLVLMRVCGLGYPLLMTGISQVIFPVQANGSLIEINGQAVGSALVGQDFTDARFMKCRPSAVGYNTYTQAEKDSGAYTGVRSGSKNYAPSNPELVKRVEGDIAAFLAVNPSVSREDIPADLLTASASGLDPHISPAAAIQIPALAKTTGLTQETIESIVADCTAGKLLGIFGEDTVNVLKVNLRIAEALGLVAQTKGGAVQ